MVTRLPAAQMQLRGDAGLDFEQRVGQIRQRFIPEGTFAHKVEINVEAGHHRRKIIFQIQNNLSN